MTSEQLEQMHDELWLMTKRLSSCKKDRLRKVLASVKEARAMLAIELFRDYAIAKAEGGEG